MRSQAAEKDAQQNTLVIIKRQRRPLPGLANSPNTKTTSPNPLDHRRKAQQSPPPLIPLTQRRDITHLCIHNRIRRPEIHRPGYPKSSPRLSRLGRFKIEPRSFRSTNFSGHRGWEHGNPTVPQVDSLLVGLAGFPVFVFKRCILALPHILAPHPTHFTAFSPPNNENPQNLSLRRVPNVPNLYSCTIVSFPLGLHLAKSIPQNLDSSIIPS